MLTRDASGRARYPGSIRGLVLIPLAMFMTSAPAILRAQVTGAEPGPATAGAGETPLTLAEAERRALETSPALKAAEARIQVAEGLLRQAGVYPNPDLVLDANYFTGDGRSREAVLGLLQPIPYHGKRGLERQESAERLEAARLDRDRDRLDLLLEVREAYDRIYFAAQVIKVVEDDLQATQEIQKAVQSRVAAGDAAPMESLKATVEVNRAGSRLGLARGDLAAAIAAFNLLLGSAAGAPTTVAGPPPDPDPADDLDALIARALATQPEIRSREHAAQAASFAAERARLERRPDISVGPTIGTDQGSTFAGLGLALKLPVWDHHQGTIAAADAGRNMAQHEAEAARLAVARLVADSFGRYRSARAQQLLYGSGLLAEAGQLADAARKSYEGGESGILDLLDARRTVLAVREEYDRVSLEAALAAARLRRAIGEGTE